jgi:hypothetical protein
LAQFYNAVSVLDVDVVAVTETWLKDDVLSTELFSSDYIVFRKDRNFSRTFQSRGGGVPLAVRSTLSVKLMDVDLAFDNLPEIDFICVKVHNVNSTIYICLVYIPPGLTLHRYHEFSYAFLSLRFLHGSKIIFLGDFNVTEYITFLNLDQLRGNAVPIFHILSELSIQQHNSITNDNDGLLDLVLSNLHCSVTRGEEGLVPQDPHHPCLLVSIDVRIKIRKFIYGVDDGDNFNVRAIDMEMVRNELLLIDWSFLESYEDVDFACHGFYNKLFELFDLIVPKKRKSRHNYPPWFSYELIKKIKLKHRIFKKFRVSGKLCDLEKYRMLRRDIKGDIKRQYDQYVAKAEADIKRDPNKFWQFVKFKQNGTGIPLNMTFSGAEVSGADEITGAFANYFESAYCEKASVIESSVEEWSTSCNFSLNAVNEQDVLNAISKLKLKFTAGPDMIPSFLIHECVEAFVSPLVVIFNLCLKTNAFPAIWKTARVVPVFKKGDRNCIETYRPVSICSNFSKVFEFIISDTLSFHFKSYISESQHGFVRGRSTISNLCTFTQYVANSMDLGLQTDVIYYYYYYYYYYLVKLANRYDLITGKLSLVRQ